MEATATRSPSFRRVLGNRSFSLLWAGQLISQSGDFIFDVALIWLVLDLTGSAFFTGATVAAELLPAVLFAPVAGVYVDRYDRKKVLEVSISVQGGIVAAIALLLVAHLLTFGVILLLVFFLNAAAQFPRATVPALLPRLVETDDLMAANSLYSFSTSSNQLLSLSLGGVVVAVAGVGPPLYYDAATFFVAVLLIGFVSSAYTQTTRSAASTVGSAPTGHLLSDLREGWRVVRADRVLNQLLIAGLTLNVFGGILLAVLAPYAKLSLGGTAATYGFLLAALASGSIIGAIVLGTIPIRRYVGRLLFVGVAVLGGCIALLGLLPYTLAALPVSAALGFGLVVANLPLSTLFQVRVPDHVRGRSIAVMMAILTAPQPAGALVAATLTRVLSLNGLLAVCGATVLVLTAAFVLALPHLRSASY